MRWDNWKCELLVGVGYSSSNSHLLPQTAGMYGRLQQPLPLLLHSVVVGDSQCVLLPRVFSFPTSGLLPASTCIVQSHAGPTARLCFLIHFPFQTSSPEFLSSSEDLFLCLFSHSMHRLFLLKNSSELIGLFLFIALYLFPYGPGCNNSSYAV